MNSIDRLIANQKPGFALDQRFYLMGGRTPLGEPGDPFASQIWADVWVSDDRGATWEMILDTDTPGHWPARAYFQAVTKGGDMYVLGGQDFEDSGLNSNFYSDVWRSRDGVQWEQLRALTAKDAYARSHAYCARAQLQAVTYHREKGEVSRVKVSS